MVFLFPEHGDVIADYEHVPAFNPVENKHGFAIPQKQDGSGECHYLGPNGCTIYDRAPSICRSFDCRKALLRMGDRAERRRLIAITKDDVLIAGRDRLNSLTPAERADPWQ